MILTRTSKRNILLFTAAFFLSGILHIVLYGKDFAYGFPMLFGGTLTIIWAISVQKRVTEKRLRFLMLWIAACLLLQFLLQAMRYSLFPKNIDVRRFLWYCYYIPMTLQPILCFFLAVCLYRSQDDPLPPACYLVPAVGIVLVLGVLTNDFHFQFKSFPTGVMDSSNQEVSGWLYWTIYLYGYGLYSAAYLIILNKNFRYVSGKYRWLPLFPMLCGVLYFILYPLKPSDVFSTIRIWNIGEFSAFCIISAVEACIQVGMIQANTGYEDIFSAAFIPAVILDASGRPIYQTRAADFPFEESDDIRILTHPISGGCIQWKQDIKRLNSLNLQIEEATHQIEARNAYLVEENRIRKEKLETETRNRLYDRISQIVQPQLNQIDMLLDNMEEDSENQLKKIAVLSAYIKRRANMELLSSSGTLSVEELIFAAAESLDYLQLSGMNTAITYSGAGTYPDRMIIAAYEQMEKIIEESLDSLSDLVVTIRAAQHNLTIRLMLHADDFVYETVETPPYNETFSVRVTITKDQQDMLIAFTYTEGSMGQ